MKRYIPILMSFMLLFTFSSTASATLQQQVKDYLYEYRQMLSYIYSYPSDAEPFMLSGDISELTQGGSQVLVAMEVLDMIGAGRFDDCCWVGDTPATFSEFASVDGAQILSGGWSVTYPKHSGGTGNFSTSPQLSTDYNIMVDLMGIAAAMPANPLEYVDNSLMMGHYEYDIIKSLHPLMDDLWWAFSYVDSSLLPDAIITPEFRNHYAFACVVCFGAGFYDLSRLHVKQSETNYTATADYDTIYSSLSSFAKNWMTSQATNQYPTDINWNGKPPFQISTGPTWQSAPASTTGTRNDATHMYPTHCHGSTEIYKELRPFDLAYFYGSQADKDAAVAMMPSWYDTSSSPDDTQTDVGVFGTANYIADMFPQWQASIPVMPYSNASGAFKNARFGSFYYNGSRDYHALFSGRWVQLTQWARLTSPAEGTYFPLHNTNITPSEPTGGCNVN